MPYSPTFILLVLALTLQTTTQQPTNFDYKNHGTDWDTGDCIKNLGQQSPIILNTETANKSKNSFLFADFRETQSTGTVFNTTLYIKPGQSTDFFGELYTKTMDEKPVPFKAFQIRIRTRSQHRIADDKGFKDLQIQIFTKQLYDSSKNIKMNIGLLFEVDDLIEDPFIAQIIAKYSQNDKPFQLKVNLNHLLSRQEIFDFWFYLGSTSMPPCTNAKINWLIPSKIYKLSSKQLNFFKNLYPLGNWRDVQPTDKNQIGYQNVAYVQ